MDVTYDDAERAAQWRNSNKNGGSLSYFDYSRDSKGLITKSFREATHTVYYAYDANDRLLTELWAKSGASPTEVYGYRYAYDLAGNRTKAKVNAVDTYYFYDQGNQLTVKGANSAYTTPTYYVYDRNGSLTNLVEPSGATYFAYNAAGLVAKIKWRDLSFTYFYYDGNLQRFGMNANGTVTYFLWDGPNLLQELNADYTVKDEHTNALTPIMGIGQLTETYRPSQGASLQKIYPVMDPRGTISKWIQSDGTTVLSSREYDAFGNIVPSSASGAWPTRFGYQGQAWMEILSANGTQRLFLSQSRLYDAVDGRFLQNEPLLNRRSFAHFLFVRNNPEGLVDPEGLQECDPCDQFTVEQLRAWLLDSQEYDSSTVDQLRDWLLNSQEYDPLDPGMNALDLFAGRKRVDTREYVDFGRQNPNLPVMEKNLEGQLVSLGQQQARGYTGGPYAFGGGPGYTDEWGFRHQTFCMSCHDPVNPVAQLRMGVASGQAEWWKFGAETAVDLFPLGSLARGMKAALYSEYMYFRAQGYTASAAFRLARPYTGIGHHFIQRTWLNKLISRCGPRTGRFLTWYKDSPFNVLSGRGMTTGRFYELHAQLHSGGAFGRVTAQGMRLLPGQAWRAASATALQPVGRLGYLWYGSPVALKLSLGAGGAAGAVGAYNLINGCDPCKKKQ